MTHSPRSAAYRILPNRLAATIRRTRAGRLMAIPRVLARPRLASLGAVALVVALLGAATPAVFGARQAVAATDLSVLRWGIVGNDGTQLAAERAAGVTAKLVDLSWAAYMPKPGTENPSYVSSVRSQIASLRKAGFAVILGLGVQSAPSWVHANYANTYYVDQYGERYDGGTTPGSGDVNFVWNPTMRALQQQYLGRVFADLGTNFAAVRLGGGRYGELGYPVAATSAHSNTYWAFDANAAATNPVPGWTPGMASPNGEAGTFLNWYLAKLADYETWQVSTLRQYYAGPAMMLFPSWGIRPGQAQAAIDVNLNGSTSAEINGEVQRGYDYARLVAAIADPNVIIQTDWLDAPYGNDSSTNPDDWTPVHYLASLAAPRGLDVYGQNTGQGSASVMAFAVSQAMAYGLVGMSWYNESQLFSGSYATLSDYAAQIASHPAPTATPTPTATPSPMPTPTSSSTPPPTTSPSATPSPTPVATATPSPTPQPTSTPSPTPAPTSTPTPAPTPTPTAPAAANVRWGLIGNGTSSNGSEAAAGITTKMVSLNWGADEPSEGTFSTSYEQSIAAIIAADRAAGFNIILSLGVQYDPAWLHTYANSYYVDQYGDAYVDSAGADADFVWNATMRQKMAAYIAHVFSVFGTNFAAVRIGGGHYGELGFPPNGYNGHANTYWAWSAGAQASDPVPGWLPGQASPNGEAQTFWNWYDGSLTSYLQWQVATLRASYAGPLIVLEPGFGARPSGISAAIADNLNGASSQEINGEIQTAHDYTAHAQAISDPNVWLDSTWLDCPYGNDSSSDPTQRTPIGYLAYLASQRGLQLYGENTGNGSASDMQFTVVQAVKWGLQGFVWMNETQLLSGNYATLSNYAALIAANP